MENYSNTREGNNPFNFNNDPARYAYADPSAPEQPGWGVRNMARLGMGVSGGSPFSQQYDASQTSYPVGPMPPPPPQPSFGEDQSTYGAPYATFSAPMEMEDDTELPGLLLTGKMGSVREAREWRRQAEALYPMTHPEIPVDFEQNADDAVTRIYNAIADCSQAMDGNRRTTGQGVGIRSSKGYKGIVNNTFVHQEVEAGSWIIWDNLLTLHRYGSDLRPVRDFPPNLKNERQDLDLTITERLDEVVRLLLTFKTVCREAIGPDERKIRIIVRAPIAILRTKKQYQVSNDRRGDVYRKAREFVPPNKPKKTTATTGKRRKTTSATGKRRKTAAAPADTSTTTKTTSTTATTTTTTTTAAATEAEIEASEQDPFERFGKAHSMFNFWPVMESPWFGGPGRRSYSRK